MNRKDKEPSALTVRTIGLGVIVLVVLVFAVSKLATRGEDAIVADDKLFALAQCLTDSGAKMYGASWCSHCNAQKKSFGDAVDLMPYVECSDEVNRHEQEQVCKDAGITGYPTWVFADGSRLSGNRDFAELAAHAGCEWAE